MLFGTLEIFLCLGSVMLVIFAIGLSLVVQNVAVARADAWQGLKACPHCRKALNPEAHVCRYCLKELNEFIVNEN